MKRPRSSAISLCALDTAPLPQDRIIGETHKLERKKQSSYKAGVQRIFTSTQHLRSAKQVVTATKSSYIPLSTVPCTSPKQSVHANMYSLRYYRNVFLVGNCMV